MKLDLCGQTFGHLHVQAREPNKNGRTVWWCHCRCGVALAVRGSALTTGNTKSCGCGRREAMARTGSKNGTHRLSRTVEYHSWRAMIARCYDAGNNRYQYYGAKGVTVCDRWRNSFEAFLADMGNKPGAQHSIDRFPDNNGNYEPGNCRWATPSEQSSNRRPYRCHTTKLEPYQVLSIRQDTRPDTIIGAEYGVSGRHVGSIKRREVWNNIGDDDGH